MDGSGKLVAILTRGMDLRALTRPPRPIRRIAGRGLYRARQTAAATTATATGLVLLLYKGSRLLAPGGRMSGEWRSMLRFARRSNQILQTLLELY